MRQLLTFALIMLFATSAMAITPDAVQPLKGTDHVGGRTRPHRTRSTLAPLALSLLGEGRGEGDLHEGSREETEEEKSLHSTNIPRMVAGFCILLIGYTARTERIRSCSPA